MKITEIHVHAGRTFNDPHESYANFRPGITLRATIGDGEDAMAAASELRHLAENEIERVKSNLLSMAESEYAAETARISAAGSARRHAADEVRKLRSELVEAMGAKEGLGFLKELLDDDDIPF